MVLFLLFLRDTYSHFKDLLQGLHKKNLEGRKDESQEYEVNTVQVYAKSSRTIYASS